jgi:hypothetical protein
MTLRLKIFFLLTTFFVTTNSASALPAESSSFSINTRFSFYSYEKSGELLLHIPPGMQHANLAITINVNSVPSAKFTGDPVKEILRIPFDIALAPGEYDVEAVINQSNAPGSVFRPRTRLIILSPKSSEVKTDRLTGGLIVNRRQFFPFGFYCYSPVNPLMPEEEFVRGFNMMSPYQKIAPETLSERKAYMDRCALIGMKVHYNLLSVSGGGGVGSKIEGITDEEKKTRLIQEIEAFRDHPALLAWYISDEPNGRKITPEELGKVYSIVKQYDPWHPVSIVFMAPFTASVRYAGALDIVMADPYPVPDHPLSLTGNTAAQLRDEFKGTRPVWIVPQVFGGGELWRREPTLQEVRSMTWQSVINGATGIQYFVRQGQNYFPKSVPAWNECGRIAVEVAELTPWLLSDEETLHVSSGNVPIQVGSRMHEGQLMIMAVNSSNQPEAVSIRINGFGSGTAKVIFENRSVPVSGGVIKDYLSPLGSQVYMVRISTEKQEPEYGGINLVNDPGFEENQSPGVPAACYARPGGDRGATYFTDTREHHSGDHSLRLITPEKDKGVSLRFFPVRMKAGASYSISVWAKSDPEQRHENLNSESSENVKGFKSTPQYVEIMMGKFLHARFVPDSQWKEFITFITIPRDTVDTFRANLILKMPGQGVAWFDDLKINEDK